MVATLILSFKLIAGLNGIVRLSISFEASDCNEPAASSREEPPSCLINFLRDDLTFISGFFKINCEVNEILKS
jgi:hypothetical protein